MKRLGVNIDHIATLRNARGETHPSPLLAAKLAIKCGADSVTIHLREDRRHIKDSDLIKIKKLKKIPLNLEMAPTTKGGSQDDIKSFNLLFVTKNDLTSGEFLMLNILKNLVIIFLWEQFTQPLKKWDSSESPPQEMELLRLPLG